MGYWGDHLLGAILGDIVGSRFEFDNYRKKDFNLFSKDCFFTDDTVMTCAVAQAIMTTERRHPVHDEKYYQILSEETIKTMQSLGNKYPDRGYGSCFKQWLKSDFPRPYHSFGNGSAMRVSPVGDFADSEAELKRLSLAVTAITHDHPEGIKGAQGTALAIFLARNASCQKQLRNRLVTYYDLDFTLAEIRADTVFNDSCQESVPQAIVAFLAADSFTDTLRNAVSIGGDSDTLAAIAGAIAESFFGIPPLLKRQVFNYLTDELAEIVVTWEKFLEKKRKDDQK